MLDRYSTQMLCQHTFCDPGDITHFDIFSPSHHVICLILGRLSSFESITFVSSLPFTFYSTASHLHVITWGHSMNQCFFRFIPLYYWNNPEDEAVKTRLSFLLHQLMRDRKWRQIKFRQWQPEKRRMSHFKDDNTHITLIFPKINTSSSLKCFWVKVKH